MLCLSASATAPTTTWPTCAPPPTTMIRLPYTFWNEGARSAALTTGQSQVSYEHVRSIAGDVLELEIDCGEPFAPLRYVDVGYVRLMVEEHPGQGVKDAGLVGRLDHQAREPHARCSRS